MEARRTMTIKTRVAAAAVLLICLTLASGCGDGVVCGSSTGGSVQVVGCTGDPRDDGLTIGAFGQEAEPQP